MSNRVALRVIAAGATVAGALYALRLLRAHWRAEPGAPPRKVAYSRHAPDVPIQLTSTATMETLDAFAPFGQWLSVLVSPDGLVGGHGAVLRGITVRDVYMFGARAGFVFLDVDISMPTPDGANVKLPGAVLLRGGAVAVLVWCKRDEEIHVLLVRQPRVATGAMQWEIPAGMLHSDGDCRGTAFDEIRQETGLEFSREALERLPTTPFASQGLLDERFTFYAAHCPDLLEKAQSLDASALGVREEGEVIASVAAVAMTRAHEFDDSKLIAALAAAVASVMT